MKLRSQRRCCTTLVYVWSIDTEAKLNTTTVHLSWNNSLHVSVPALHASYHTAPHSIDFNAVAVTVARTNTTADFKGRSQWSSKYSINSTWSNCKRNIRISAGSKKNTYKEAVRVELCVNMGNRFVACTWHDDLSLAYHRVFICSLLYASVFLSTPWVLIWRLSFIDFLSASVTTLKRRLHRFSASILWY